MRWLLVLALSAACATAPTNRASNEGDREDGHSVADVPVFGFGAEVTERSGMEAEGELLAVDAEHVWINGPGGPAPLHRMDIDHVIVWVSGDKSWVGFGVWTLLGTLSSVSNGLFLVFSAPIWLGTGIATSTASSSYNRARFEKPNFTNLWQFARYPQGLPVRLWNCDQHPPMRGIPVPNARWPSPPPEEPEPTPEEPEPMPESQPQL
jgi:hypothetical protein